MKAAGSVRTNLDQGWGSSVSSSRSARTRPSLSARRTAHRILNRLTIPASPFWRNDIGGRLRAQLPELQAYGYARDLAYSA
jgi:hypothetical protein